MPTNQKPEPPTEGEAPAKPFTVRLPGFVSDHAIGLGDVVTRVATRVGFTACGGCTQRAAQMNQWISFTGRRLG